MLPSTFSCLKGKETIFRKEKYEPQDELDPSQSQPLFISPTSTNIIPHIIELTKMEFCELLIRIVPLNLLNITTLSFIFYYGSSGCTTNEISQVAANTLILLGIFTIVLWSFISFILCVWMLRSANGCYFLHSTQ